MLTLILKSRDIYKVEAVANRISLSLPYEHQMEINPESLTSDVEKGTSELPTSQIYSLPIKFGSEEKVNVEFVINLDVEEVYAQPPNIAVSTVQKKTSPTMRLSELDE